jgi:hypothetical protein
MTEWLDLMLEEVRRKDAERAEADREIVERARTSSTNQDDPPPEKGASRPPEGP